MNRLEKINNILDGSSIRLRESYFINNHNELYNDIVNFTNITDISFKERLWYWVNDIKYEFSCKCGKKTTFNKNWLDGYRKWCSPKCAQTDKSTKEKRKKTVQKKYGVDNIAKLEETKKKQESTNLERYGTKSSFQNKDVQKKWKDKVKNK
jgi:hypothetical protein